MAVATSKITVLVVDDQLITRLGLITLLGQFADLQVVGEAENGETAVKSALELSPAVILMDIGMPIMNGIDAVKKIKAAAPQLRVVIFTESSTDADILAALSAGANGYCLKECQANQIAVTIRAVNEGIACLDPAIAKKILALTQAPGATEKALNSTGSFNKFGLSPRELEVLSLVVDGQSNQQIADGLYLSIDTVKNHMRYILAKLAVSDRTQAAVKAMKEGIV
jgi:DNA-binding NarL/FixJ family response regulator